MTLPSSGNPISLNEIHVEVTGTSGTEVTINDSDVRGLTGAASGSEIEFADFYGLSFQTHLLIPQELKLANVVGWGFRLSLVGSIVPTTFAELTINRLMRTRVSETIEFVLTGSGANPPAETVFTGLEFIHAGGTVSASGTDADTSTNGNLRFWEWAKSDFTTAEWTILEGLLDAPVSGFGTAFGINIQ